MGVLSRFKDIMSANINAVLEKAESKNADKLLEQFLREARNNLEQVKAETAAIIADEMAAARKITALDGEIVRLTGYAEQAVTAGNDNDALKFLEAKEKAAASKLEAEKAYILAKENSDHMRQLTKKLMADVQEADAKLTELKGKLAIAEQTEKMNELSEKISGTNVDFSDYDRLADAVQKRIDAADAKAELAKELNQHYDLDKLKEKYEAQTAQSTSTAQDELAALKAKLGK